MIPDGYTTGTYQVLCKAFQKTECRQVSMHIHWKIGQRFSHNEEPDPLKTCWNWFKIVKSSLLWPLAVLIVHRTGALPPRPKAELKKLSKILAPQMSWRREPKREQALITACQGIFPGDWQRPPPQHLNLGLSSFEVCFMPCTRCLHLVNLVSGNRGKPH